MVSKKILVTDAMGIHMRPAKRISEKALRYECVVNFKHGNYTGNAKSLLGLLAGSVKANQEIELICDGKDEEVALKELSDFIEKVLS